jgi:hypothetical protein
MIDSGFGNFLNNQKGTNKKSVPQDYGTTGSSMSLKILFPLLSLYISVVRP